MLIIGLDGATFDVLDPLMDEGRMPRLKEAVSAGAAGPLHSTIPPITPAAWTTFLTGKQPGTHGIIDFERYDRLTNKLTMNSTRCLEHVRNLWQILGDKGLKVGSVNVPMTYPPVPVNGFMVSGFETPGADSDFVYPPELKREILSRWPDPTLKTNWRRSLFGGDKLFAENVAYMSRSFHQGADMTMWLGDKLGWDVLMVVFKLIDNLQHKTWRYLDPRWAARNPSRCEIVKRSFEEADRAVGRLLDYADAHHATVFIVSDHGHGSLEGKIQPNLLLKQWGYLTLHGGGTRRATSQRPTADGDRGGGPVRGPST
jgi:predicted AlkP superfamily phosphohydrolase/phosphomutase